MVTTQMTGLQKEKQHSHPQAHDHFTGVPYSENGEINRLLCAALVSEEFRNLLLENPTVALKNGYLGESFTFTRKERSAVLAIDAATLDEFTVRLMDHLNRQDEPSPMVRQEYEAWSNVPLQVDL